MNHLRIDNLYSGNGFGYASNNIVKSLRALGHEVSDTLKNPDVEIWWDQPHWIEWKTNAYRIAYFPWESTKLMPRWYKVLEAADEIWTPSPIIAEWLSDDLNRQVYVFEHGVDPIWKPVKRSKDKIRFLHMGFESARKYGPQTMSSFRREFVFDENVQLILKMDMSGWGLELEGKIRSINERYGLDRLIELFAESNTFLFLSAGEGFGLPPLQAAATGMPVIINTDWCPYADLLDPRLAVSSKMKVSPWQDLHPGNVMRPDFDEAREKMRFLVDNYDSCVEFAQSKIDEISARYDWIKLTNDAFKELEKRL